VAVSFIFGTLCVIPFFVTARHLFDDQKAFMADLLFAANSYFVRYSVYVIRDMTALFFFLTSAALLTSRKPARPYRWTAIGLSAAIAVYTRPEYMLIYGLSLAVCGLAQRRWKALCLAGLSFFLLLLFMTLFKAHPEIGLLRRVLLERVAAGLSAFVDHLQGFSFPGAVWSPAVLTVKSLRELLGLMTPLAGAISLIGAGHAAWRWRQMSKATQVLLITIFSAAILYAVWGAVGGYFTRRFFILPGGLLFMFVGDGVEVIGKWARRRREQVMTLTLILLFSSVTLYTLFHEVGGRREGLRLAGLHISRNSHGTVRPVILSDERIIAFYARGIHAPLDEKGGYEGIASWARDRRVDYVVLKVLQGQGPGEAVEALVQTGSLALVATLPYGKRDGKERELRIYRIRPGPS
jgi:hypothetical protein